MEITESNLCVSLWRTNETGLGPDEYYMDVLLEVPENRAKFRVIHAAAAQNIKNSSRRIFRIPDMGKLIVLSLEDPTGYGVLKHLAVNQMALTEGLPKLLFHTGFSNQTIPQMLASFPEKNRVHTLALSADLLIACTTLTNPDGLSANPPSPQRRLDTDLINDLSVLRGWKMWELDLKTWSDHGPGQALIVEKRDHFVPIWA